MKRAIIKLLKIFFRTLVGLLYRVELKGMENYHAAGERVLIVANHTSFLDAALLTLFLPGKPTFAINTEMAQRKIFRPFYAFATLFPMDPTNPLSTKALIKYLKGDRKAVIFPEGRITTTGSLMKIYDGPGMVAEHAESTILPVRIDGAERSPLSRLQGIVPLRWFPKVKITILPPQRIVPPEGISRHEQRKYSGERLHRIMVDMMFETSDHHQTLFDAVIDARKTFGRKTVVLDDIKRKPLSYDRLITGAFVLGEKLAALSHHGERVGLLLPNASATVVSLLGLQAHGRTPAMLNFTAGLNGMRGACETAQINTVITSRSFIEKGKLEPVIEGLSESVEICYLEDIAEGISLADKLRGLLASRFARSSYRRRAGAVDPQDAAVVIFTSGSEGVPKGVVLSHLNLLANYQQMRASVPFNPTDSIINVLPIFHSFGLTAATILPLLSGIKCFLYPSPLHYRIIPEIAYEIGATVIFGTNTFLAGYAKHAHPYDFHKLRYVFAGAEKVHEQTRKVWMDKFGHRILDGYGASETSPVLSFNTPMACKLGSVGQLMPAIDYRLEPVEGVAEGGRLHVRGPNVMSGYLLHDNPGVLVPPQSSMGAGWYDTGDIVTVDDEGFVTIQGRAKRFAKIGGEMVSLAAVEELVNRVWPDALHAVVSVADAQKGEQLVLITERKESPRAELLGYARETGVSELSVPRHFITDTAIPLLGTGKIDYPAAQRIADAAQ